MISVHNLIFNSSGYSEFKDHKVQLRGYLGRFFQVMTLLNRYDMNCLNTLSKRCHHISYKESNNFVWLSLHSVYYPYFKNGLRLKEVGAFEL